MFQGGQAWKIFFLFTVLTPTWEGYLARLTGTKEMGKNSCCLTLGWTILQFCIFQCCGSGMFIPDPRFRIPDPGSKNSNKRDGWKKLWSYCTFFCSHKFHKIENICIFEMLKRKIWANFSKIYRTFYPKIFTKISKIWVWDPGSEEHGFFPIIISSFPSLKILPIDVINFCW